jgi:NAD(P)-dependent dehydrogenase (short-subunit alcohol dehydrogenase family)
MRIADLFDVTGHVALVTGGSSGIGFACAEVLAANGARLCIVGRDAGHLEAAAKQLSALSEEVMTEVADAADSAAMADVVGRVLDRFGRLDIAFLNAGIGGGPAVVDVAGARNPAGAVESLDDRVWYGFIENDLTSVFASLKAVVPPMRRQRSGSIVVTTSVAAVKTEAFVSTAYQAAKAGAAHLIHQVALELARDNVRVNAMAPGAMLTNVGGGRMADPAVRRQFTTANAMGRVADPREIQGLALFLASPASSYVTGAQLLIDGGASVGHID